MGVTALFVNLADSFLFLFKYKVGCSIIVEGGGRGGRKTKHAFLGPTLRGGAVLV